MISASTRHFKRNGSALRRLGEGMAPYFVRRHTPSIPALPPLLQQGGHC
jgi:hypothetical protein